MALQTHVNLSNQSLTDAGQTLNANIDAVNAALDPLNPNNFGAVSPGSTAPTIVKTFSVPANYFDVDGKGITYKTVNDFAANGDNKQLRVLFGAHVMFDTGVTVAQGLVVISGQINRVGSNSQLTVSQNVAADATTLPASAQGGGGFASETDTAPIVMSVELTGFTAGADVTAYTLDVNPIPQ